MARVRRVCVCSGICQLVFAKVEHTCRSFSRALAAVLSACVCVNSDMDWTNESVIEFLELVHAEPSIWNHRVKTHRNRVHEAWIRIKNNFSLPCSIEDLKRKRNSLLTQYRDILKKIKSSQQTSSGDHEIYKPTWFAFDIMHSYLKDLYDGRVTVKSEELMVSYDEDPLSTESDSCNEIQPSGKPQSGMNSNYKRLSNSRMNSHSRRLSHESNTPSEPDSFISKKRRGMQEPAATQMKEAFFIANERSYEDKNQTSSVRQCDLYGQLIAEKLKPLEQDDRLQLMNEIDNLVFNYLMTIRKQKASQNNMSSRAGQCLHLPGPSNPRCLDSVSVPTKTA